MRNDFRVPDFMLIDINKDAGHDRIQSEGLQPDCDEKSVTIGRKKACPLLTLVMMMSNERKGWFYQK